MRRAFLVGVAVTAVLWVVAGLRAEVKMPRQTQQQTPVMGGHGDPLGGVGSGAGSEDLSAERLKHRQEMAGLSERHQHMAADADKLLQMATELKAEVDKSTKDETSVSAYNKADAIERLAHDVKQRLKN